MLGRLLATGLLTAGSIVGQVHAQSSAPTLAGDGRSAATDDGTYLVQVSSQRSEAEARTSYQGLQARYPSLLGNRSPIIRPSGIQLNSGPSVSYHVLVGPFDHDAAMRFCDQLRKAGAGCFVPRR
jgi:SPOR domain